MERIENETEIHRFQKAIKSQLALIDTVDDILFTDSIVRITAPIQILKTVGGQRVLALMINLLARMKTAVSVVSVCVPENILLHDTIPLQGTTLRAGLQQLVRSLRGTDSAYNVEIDLDGTTPDATVTVAIGHHGIQAANIGVWADGWTAFINTHDPHPDWDTPIPFGSHVGATLAVAEVFKHLLVQNFPNKTQELGIKFLQDVEFSTLTYGRKPIDGAPTHLPFIQFDNIAIAGVGAGGSAALYSLALLPDLIGDITLIDYGHHKKSNLNRYLLSTYDDCHSGSSKVRNAHMYLHKRHPMLNIHIKEQRYEDIERRNFRFIVSTVDTIEARWIIQRDMPEIILDAAVVDTIYTVLRVYPDGMCLGCKHPYDPELEWKRRASMWGIPYEQLRVMGVDAMPVTTEDIERLAEVQNQPVEMFESLIGVPFSKVPSITECGNTQFDLHVPNQAASIPFVTTMAGILVASEIVKEQVVPDLALHNWFDHNMLWKPKSNRYKFRKSKTGCSFCKGSLVEQ